MRPEVIRGASRKLRNNSTRSEVILWNYLKWKQLWYKFLRQSPLYVFTEDCWLKRYIIPDFYCKEKKLILEIDWNIHKFKEISTLDNEKEKLIKQKWLNIIRIKNEEILYNINNTIKTIKNKLL